uniref:Glycosyltransferase subfamily 4-like N-terminal domain-containing protein n=1 Tax=Clastoptera arizonana TaxID=38151 RepID=A0A1B6DP58_9HEMI
MNSLKKKNVAVIVLGDIGRSPRMQYHAISLLKEGYNVDLIGYDGVKPVAEIQNDPNIKLHFLSRLEFSKSFPLLFGYGLKIIWQCLCLFWTLLWKRRSNYVIVQTPPAIPALFISWLYCLLVQSKLIIDWHNYAFTIMSLTHGKKHMLVKMSIWFEGFFGRKSDGNLCVTKAMREDLKSRWNIK